ncbi:unnamed protein product [Rodentolepis nana]|uniref:Ig-like domain-containing protein n=1 Tax=Rodentolepis nana TaxID=102285 RepID=A0A0R3TDI1_RODNA|nr:unnamed protein product [Rodentolepis nana]
MECIVNGYPDPDLLWFKGVYDPNVNNIPLYDSAKYDLEKTRSYGAVGTNVTDVISLLKVKNIRESDYSNYTCMAANRYGMDMAMTNSNLQFLRRKTMMLELSDNFPRAD